MHVHIFAYAVCAVFISTRVHACVCTRVVLALPGYVLCVHMCVQGQADPCGPVSGVQHGGAWPHAYVGTPEMA